MRRLAWVLVAGFVIACSSTEALPSAYQQTPPADTDTDTSTSDASTTETETDGGKPSTEDDGGTPLSPAAIVGDAECARANACTPAMVKTLYGDLATCRARRTLENGAAFASDGHATVDIAAAKACAQALSTASCSDGYEGLTPAACVWKGKRSNKASCSSNGQCQSGLCNPDGVGCGECKTDDRYPLGATCYDTGSCKAGLYCKGNKCVERLVPGQSCGTTDICKAGGSCVNGTCTADGATVGAPCDLTSRSCNGYLGLYCKIAVGASTGTCESYSYVGAGADCRNNGVFCEKGTCLRDPTGPSSSRICFAHIADGETCNPAISTMNVCLSPSRCVDDKCTPPTATSVACK